MILTTPVMITSRLLPGVSAGGATISIKYASRAGYHTRYTYHIDLPDGIEHTGADLVSGCQGGNLQQGLASLLCFLAAAGWTSQSMKCGGQHSRLFPPYIVEWCILWTDELALLSSQLEEPGKVYIDEHDGDEALRTERR